MKLVRMATMLAMLAVMLVANVGAQEDLDCYMVGDPECNSPGVSRISITCDWDEPDDCASQEPALDECVDRCFWECSQSVYYPETYGNPCGNFNCACGSPVD